MEKEQGLNWLKQTKIIAIARGILPEHIAPVAQALYEGGVRVMEITLNTPNALSMIRRLQDEWGERMFIGAGTVLDVEGANQALGAGASFLVTPHTDEPIIRYACDQQVPIFPGALTPTEIVRAWKSGATAIKVFPFASLGASYMKELMGPLDSIPLMAVGGVTEQNIGQYIQMGCYGVGIAGSLLNPRAIASGQYEQITRNARALLAASQP